jgi:uncharacterized protein YjiS (DUF1127 family)
MTQILENLGSWLKRQERIRRTVRELSVLSDKELFDIGISRCDIQRVASGEPL